MARIKYTKELLEDVVSSSTSMGQVIRTLGLRPAGGNYSHLKQKITRFGINTDHFVPTTTGSRTNFGGGTKRRSHEVIFSVKSVNGPYEKGVSLKRALLDEGRGEYCDMCGIGAEWNGFPLSLQVDHINGQRWDDRRDNLRFLCPNCHSQTETFSGKNAHRSVME